MHIRPTNCPTNGGPQIVFVYLNISSANQIAAHRLGGPSFEIEHLAYVDGESYDKPETPYVQTHIVQVMELSKQ